MLDGLAVVWLRHCRMVQIGVRLSDSFSGCQFMQASGDLTRTSLSLLCVVNLHVTETGRDI